VPLADVGAELLFQVVSERCERAAIVITTNLPFFNVLRFGRENRKGAFLTPSFCNQ